MVLLSAIGKSPYRSDVMSVEVQSAKRAYRVLIDSGLLASAGAVIEAAIVRTVITRISSMRVNALSRPR